MTVILKAKYLQKRGSRPEVFCKKVLLEISQNSKEKNLCQSLFFNKVSGRRIATLLKKRL